MFIFILLYQIVQRYFIQNNLIINRRIDKQIMYIHKIEQHSAFNYKMLMHSETCVNCKYSTMTKKGQICKWNIHMNILCECIYIKFKHRQNWFMVIINQSISRLIGKIKVAISEMIRILYFVLRSGHKMYVCVCLCVRAHVNIYDIAKLLRIDSCSSHV